MNHLYTFLKQYCSRLDAVTPLTGWPVIQDIQNSFVWLGTLADDLLEVEIRESKDVVGWAYNPKVSIIFFNKWNGDMCECWISDFKTLISDKFAAKKFKKTYEPENGLLYRSESGRVVGWVKVSDVVSISNTIK